MPTTSSASSASPSPPGLMIPTQKSFVNGAGNPRDSAIAAMKQTNATQNALNKSAGVSAGGGRGHSRHRTRSKRRTHKQRRFVRYWKIMTQRRHRHRGRRTRMRSHRHRRGGTGAPSEPAKITVPQFHMPYTPQGGVGSNPNDQIKSTSSTSMQSTAWAANDKLAMAK